MKIQPCTWHELKPEEEQLFHIQEDASPDQQIQYSIVSELKKHDCSKLGLNLMIIGLIPLILAVSPFNLFSSVFSGTDKITLYIIALRFAVLFGGIGVVMLCLDKNTMSAIIGAKNVSNGKFYLADGTVTGKSMKHTDAGCDYYLHINQIPVKCGDVYHEYHKNDPITIVISENAIVGIVRKEDHLP